MALRVMTFNVENLFARYDFRELEHANLLSLQDVWDPVERATLIRAHWNALHDEMRTFTALSLLSGEPDVVCLQEVESFEALRFFHDRYLMRLGGRQRGLFPHQVLIEGNDRRGIDVAVLSRYPLERIVTHQHVECDVPTPLGPKRQRIFRRDCLEVHVDCGNAVLPVFVCHFKSMDGSREASRAWRRLESEAVRQIIRARFPDPAAADWLVAGDLNDYTELDGIGDWGHGLGPLLDDGFAVDLIKRVPDPAERWTHFWPEGNSYAQIDYLLASPALAAKNPTAVPSIIRQGQPFRAGRHRGERWPRVGWDRPKASDHCPVVVTLESLGTGAPPPPLQVPWPLEVIPTVGS
jgi:endonuclease/exonuclease/phosphatase family metal-dependent hydrolase